MTRIISMIILFLLITGQILSQPKEDILAKILNEVGFSKEDIGYHSKGYWNRYPLDVPYKLTSFESLYQEPLKLYDYSRVMSNVVEKYLDPAYSDSLDDGLYQMVYHLGIDKKLGGFRSYGPVLLSVDDIQNPLAYAMEKLNKVTNTKIDLINEILTKCEALPDTVQKIIGELIINLADAVHWRNLAFRNCDTADMKDAFNIRDLALTQEDGNIYYPQLDDIAKTIDFPSLHFAALKVAAASERAEKMLIPFVKEIPKEFEMEIETPLGKIAIFSPFFKRDNLPPTKSMPLRRPPIPGWYEYDATNTLLIIDFGRNMIYNGTPGATASLSNPISVVIDLGGDDYYGHKQTSYPPSAGVGLLGIGLVLDSKGNDHYNGTTYAQGAGLFGVGILLDREGNDKYKASMSAQGCGYFGIGLCFDGTGDDEFYMHRAGQGMGGIGGGVGVLASFDGNDKYTAEPDPEVINLADYHSQNKINGNQVQGAGFGRRGDITDGHSWAGGLGAIIDIHGNDYYYSGNWSLGVAYWFATGIAIDRFGDDVYKSCYFTQGSGAHYCNGILIDEAGNDKHELYETAGAGLGFGWDYTNAFLINKGGDDIYRAKMISMGLAQIRSNAFLIDIGGDDKYYLGKETPGLGEATYRRDYDNPSKLTPYNFYSKSFGGFIDIGGVDLYFEYTDKEETVHPRAKNNSLWLQPMRSDSTFGANNFGVGIDIESGTVPELFKWDR